MTEDSPLGAAVGTDGLSSNALNSSHGHLEVTRASSTRHTPEEHDTPPLGWDALSSREPGRAGVWLADALLIQEMRAKITTLNGQVGKQASETRVGPGEGAEHRGCLGGGQSKPRPWVLPPRLSTCAPAGWTGHSS